MNASALTKLGVPADPVLDANQLLRIEGVHRGFLYQHLYAVGCLLLAQNAGSKTIVVERDEDIEIVALDRRLYVQVKTRSAPLTPSDISSAMERFDTLRVEHETGKRQGSAEFVVASNICPGPALLARIEQADWPTDTTIRWPGMLGAIDNALPEPQPDISASLAKCADLAATLPYALLTPETLVWKLAGAVMAAAAGNSPRMNHAFQTSELPTLFEQLVVQLQDFPAPPAIYRSHANEPSLESLERVRIVTGYSGSGKTSWVSQAALHTANTIVYFDVAETPGSALASALARELAARLFGRTGGRLGEVLLPGATGPEILHIIGRRLAASCDVVTIVLDNAHRAPPSDLQALLRQGARFNFLLLCQPGRNVRELGALLGIAAEPLQGWSTDTVALEVSAHDCRGDYATCRGLTDLTAGVPLYVRNAIAIAKNEYEGSIRRLCDDLETKTHVVETAQELILTRVFDALPTMNRDGIGVLSLSDIPLEKTDASALLTNVLGIDEKAVATLLRQLRSGCFIDVYGGSRLKVHDAIRLLGQTHLMNLGEDTLGRAQLALKDILANSLQQDWEMSKLSLYLRMLAAVGEIKTLVQFATDELFHELGVRPEIMAFLEASAASEDTEPEDRFWALDGLVFADSKQGNFSRASERQDAMARLIADHNLGVKERLALAMKRMNILATKGDADGVMLSISEISKLLPKTSRHLRIFRYNAAHALFSLRRYDETIEETSKLIREYYELLGIGPEHVLGRNVDKIWPHIKKSDDLTDNLKHLADCLDLHATAMNAAGGTSPVGRINAIKFYQMANAVDSCIRVGQDLVDEFVARNDFTGARGIIETILLPNALRLKMLARIVPVRSQYAVVLAYCGDFDAADTEMKRLEPYKAGLDKKGQWELRNQRKVIAEIRRTGPPPQWILPMSKPPLMSSMKIGRNAPCPCGSGKKYKKCHGTN